MAAGWVVASSFGLGFLAACLDFLACSFASRFLASTTFCAFTRPLSRSDAADDRRERGATTSSFDFFGAGSESSSSSFLSVSTNGHCHSLNHDTTTINIID
jgi:hypothetical protein